MNFGIWYKAKWERRYCIWIKEEKKEGTNDVVTETYNDPLLEKLTYDDLDQSHGIGKRKKGKQPRSFIIKFARYNIRNRAFKNKVKDTGISITERRTQDRMQLLTKTRNKLSLKIFGHRMEKVQWNLMTIPSKFIMTDSSCTDLIFQP